MENKKEEESKELKNQIDNYNTLKITKSKRGQVVLLFVGFLLLTLIFSFFGVFDFYSFIAGLIIYIPILFFVYKGHRWAMICLMVLWILEKGYTGYLSIQNGGNVIGSIVFLFIGLLAIYQALKVENERRKLSSPILTQDQGGSFCMECGVKQEKEAKFCSSCGKEIFSK